MTSFHDQSELASVFHPPRNHIRRYDGVRKPLRIRMFAVTHTRHFAASLGGFVSVLFAQYVYS